MMNWKKTLIGTTAGAMLLVGSVGSAFAADTTAAFLIESASICAKIFLPSGRRLKKSLHKIIDRP